MAGIGKNAGKPNSAAPAGKADTIESLEKNFSVVVGEIRGILNGRKDKNDLRD